MEVSGVEEFAEHIAIKKVSADDAGFLFQLMNEPAVMRALNEVPTAARDWEEAVLAWREDADEEGYIIFSGEKPIGWFAVNGLLAGYRTAFLKMAALLPAYQGRHIGRYVLAKIMDDLKSAGIASLALFTNQDNRRAQRCYASCGFRIVETLTEEMADHTTVNRYKMECRL